MDSKENSEINSFKESKVKHESAYRETELSVSAIDNTRIRNIAAVIPPLLLIEQFPVRKVARETVFNTRKAVQRILNREDDRLICIIGPCSVHDTVASLEYARKLAQVAQEYSDTLLIIMRVYFEKPRSTVGWKGLINDPYLDETYHVNSGLRAARKLLSSINNLGLPCGVEFLDTLTPQFLADLVSWGAIGARTTECQLHRELASGLSMPIGFKNGTSGDVDIAVDAMISAQHEHSFLSVNKQGTVGIVTSSGNADSHIILRGGKSGTNFDLDSIQSVVDKCTKKKTMDKLIVDCSHGNSNKNPDNQIKVVESLAETMRTSARGSSILGIMVESNLFHGRQDLPSKKAVRELNDRDLHLDDPSPANQTGDPRPGVLQVLQYGVSITDACISWDETLRLIKTAHQGVIDRRALQATL